MSQASPQTTRATVNDEEVVLEVDPRSAALEVLREDLGLTGAKLVCGVGGLWSLHRTGGRRTDHHLRDARLLPRR